jgi:hypothetical protein
VLTRATPNTNGLQLLRSEFDEALDSLAQSLARQGNDKPPEVLVAEAWARFERIKAATQVKHGALIDALSDGVVAIGRA